MNQKFLQFPICYDVFYVQHRCYMFMESRVLLPISTLLGNILVYFKADTVCLSFFPYSVLLSAVLT